MIRWALAEIRSRLGVEVPVSDHVHLGEKNLGIDHAAGADHRDAMRIEHARGDQRESDLLLTDDDGVAGVVAALIANDEVGRLGEVVGDPALALVTPLRSENDVGRHAPATVDQQRWTGDG